MSAEQALRTAAQEAEKATAATVQARADRDEAIRDARAAGMRPAQIAAASGLHRTTVHAALRAAPGTTRGGDALARVAAASEAWRVAQEAERSAHEARNVAIAEALDAGAVQAADVRGMTGWASARVYQARDLGRALLAERG